MPSNPARADASRLPPTPEQIRAALALAIEHTDTAGENAADPDAFFWSGFVHWWSGDDDRTICVVSVVSGAEREYESEIVMLEACDDGVWRVFGC